jgi:hypothetical protein
VPFEGVVFIRRRRGCEGGSQDLIQNSRGVQPASAVPFVNCICDKKLNVKFTLQQAMKIQRG